MAIKLGDAFVAIGTDERELDRGLANAHRRVNRWLRDISTGIAQGVGQALANALGNAIRTGLNELGRATQAASDLNETLARTNAVYGENARAVVEWSRTTSRSIGVAQEAALSAAGSFGNMFRQMGFGSEEAAQFSQSLVEAAADIVAFHNVTEGVPAVLQDMASAFRGEYDPIQKYIPLIKAATVEQQALAETGKASAKQLTEGEKAAAAYTLIIQGMGAAVGAAAREIETAASQQRIFQARMQEARAEIGQVGLVIQQVFFRSLNELLDSMGFYGENIVQQLVVGLTRGLVAITPFLAQLRQVFVSVLQPGSPPKLLPELNIWGKAAAEEYLKGWTMADGTMLETLGRSIENILRSFVSTGNIRQTDLVRRVFGSERALVDAINEWRALGSVSVETLDRIRRAAGPAGETVASLTNAYFNLRRASKEAAEAQERFDEVTRRYDAALSPLQRKLDELREQQQRIRDEQRLEELGEIIADPTRDLSDRRLARLEQEEILLQQQMQAIENERDSAIEAERQRLEAAEQERQRRQELYDQQQAILEQQQRANELLAEEIALRERLAAEALAEQERIQREIERQRAREEAELERTAAAYLRYRLATADTAGQLEILREELAKVTEGSAEYWNILTDIEALEKRLADERATAEARGSLIHVFEETGEAAQENKQYLEDFRAALEGALNALTGRDGQQQVRLTPFWQNVTDSIRTVKEAAQEAVPFVQAFIGVVMGEGIEGDPFGDNFWLAGIIPGIRNIKRTLELFRDQDWAKLWQGFKDYVDAVVERTGDGSDPRTFGLYSWLQTTVIPALEELAEGDWKEAWEIFGGNAINGMLIGMVKSDAYQALLRFALKLSTGDIIGAFRELSAFTPEAPQGGGGGGGFGEDVPPLPNEGAAVDWWERFLEELGKAIRRQIPYTVPGMPPGTLIPQSYAPPVAPDVPVGAMAGVSSNVTNQTQLGPINLVFNVPVTTDVARQAAETVDDVLRQRGWAPI